MKYRVFEVYKRGDSVRLADVRDETGRVSDYLRDARYYTPEDAAAALMEYAAYPSDCIIVPCYG